MAKTKLDENGVETPEKETKLKLEDIEFIEALEAENDANPPEPPRTDILYGTAKRWVTLSGGSFIGSFATMQDISQRWPKASGTFQRRFYFYKGGKKIHETRTEDLNFNTYSDPVPVSKKKMKEMFPSIPFPWDDQEPAPAAEQKPDPNPPRDTPHVLYINEEPTDPKFINDGGDFYYQELGPDKGPTMHFYHLYDNDETNKMEKVYFEQEPFAELTPDEQKLLLQAHATPQVPGSPQVPQARAELGISPNDMQKPETILTFILNSEREDKKLAREELREERAAMRMAQTEMMKAIAEIKGGERSGSGFAMGDFFKMYEFFQDMSEGKVAPTTSSPLDGPIAIFDKITGALAQVAKLKSAAGANPDQIKLLQEIAAQQAASQNQNPNGEKK